MLMMTSPLCRPDMLCLRLLLLASAWGLVRTAQLELRTNTVTVTCSEDALLICPATWEPQAHQPRVFWSKLHKNREELIEDLNLYEQSTSFKEINGLYNVSGDSLHSLKIRNTSSWSTGMFRCTLWSPEGEQNTTGTVFLKVIGCPKEQKDMFEKHKAELLLLFFLGVFYIWLIIFTCKFAKMYSTLGKHDLRYSFPVVLSQEKKGGQHLKSATLPKMDLV
ncbi:CD83 antigen [Tachyglossus aculeatus]|uniref:CD83 antigen n=1 Tax=Tachyglossus aculeatus TaxID=9261 RepID=UPI0018F49AE8|nr:CD83 antigen [Tachyglossus aculeatus]